MDHIYTLKFIHVASMFGFSPLDMTTWAFINNSKTLGVYKAMNGSFKHKNNALEK